MTGRKLTSLGFLLLIAESPEQLRAVEHGVRS